MKKIYSLIALAFYSSLIIAQQDQMVTQYLFNKLNFNPAYSGASNSVSGILMYRNQWNAIQGAPTQYMFSISTPIAETPHNIGFVFDMDKIGNINSYKFSGNYAFAIPCNESSTLRLGLRAGGDMQKIDNTVLEGYTNGDPNYSNSINTTFKPSLGTGIYFETPKMALSASIPNLLVNSFDWFKSQNQLVRNFESYMGGEYLLSINQQLKLKPASYLHISQGAPFNLDMNVYGIYKDFLWLGAGFRTSNSFMIGTQILLNKTLFPQWDHGVRIGYSYDFSNNKYNSATNGTHELFIGFDLHRNQRQSLNTVSPRYF